MSGANKI